MAASPLLTGTLTQVPDFASQSGGVVGLERSTTAIGFAVAALVPRLLDPPIRAGRGVVVGWLRGGGKGVTRTIAAGWQCSDCRGDISDLAALMDESTDALPAPTPDVALLGPWRSAFGAVLFATHSEKIGWIFGIVILGLEALLMIGLLLMKVLLAGATTLNLRGEMCCLRLALWPPRDVMGSLGGSRTALRCGRETVDLGADLRAAAVMGGSVFGLQRGFWDTILIRPLPRWHVRARAVLGAPP